MRLTTQILIATLLLPAFLRAEERRVDYQTRTIQEEAEHTVVQANTLWDLAQHFYGNPWMWPTIYEANKDRVKDPHWIYPEQTLIIPGFGKMVKVVKELPRPKGPAAPPPPPEPEPEPVAPVTAEPIGVEVGDGLSTRMPGGMTGQASSMGRLRMPADWEPDGKIVEFRGRETMAAAGDYVHIRVNKNMRIRKRTRFQVYRWSAPTEADEDKTAKYVARVGIVEVDRKLSETDFRAVIVESAGSVQVNDILLAR